MADIIETDTITLAGAAFEVRALSFARLRRVLLKWQALAPGLMTPEGFDAAMEIIAAGLDREVEDVAQNVRATTPEIWAAVKVIGRVSGLAKQEEAPQEGSAGE